MPHLMTFEGHGVYAPEGKVEMTAAQAAEVNRQTNEAELTYWATKPDRFSPAYYSFPAEHLPLFGKTRPYRTSFHPCLHTYVNQSNPSEPGVANQAVVATWNGSRLGIISSARVYCHNFGGRMVAITVTGNNGANYYGRASYDNGNVIRLRRYR